MRPPSLLLILGGALTMLVPALAAQAPPADDAHPVYQDPSAAVEARVEDLLRRLTPDEKLRLLAGTGFTTQPIERLGVPAFQMSDASVGVRHDQPSPAYTASMCLAASWDQALAQRVGVALGRDCRARGVHILLAPGVNLYRAPMCGRNFEYGGEDPVLAGELAAGFIRGVQSQGVAATVKHFAANNQEFSRYDLSSDADERTLRELYLRTFQIALREGRPRCVMSSYNPVNGVHASQNGWLLNDVLKGEWGFRGLLMSDWVSTHDTLACANGGLDLEMPRARFFSAEKLRPLLDDGQISAATVDDKLRRQFRVAFEMGWFDRPQEDRSISRDDPASDAVNVEEARGGITLLKNAGDLLPLDPAKVRRVLVVGPNADHPVTGGGGSSFVMYSHALSVLTALQRAAPAGVVERFEWDAGALMPADGQAGLQAVRAADAVVVCVGYDDHAVDGADHGESGEHEDGDRRYALPAGQARLVTQLAKLNARIVVVLNAGGSVQTAEWIEHVPALLHAFYPGAEGNRALAEILFGRTNPSGKLPFSWEKRWEDAAAYGNYPDKEHPKANTYREGVFLGYRWFDARDREPLFPFGFGLSYTRFALADLRVSRAADADEAQVSVEVRNTGARAGAEVVEVYVAPPPGALPRPPRELKAFGKVFLPPGGVRTVTMKVRLADLAAWDPGTRKWTVFPGEYLFQAGDSSRDLPLRAALAL